MKTDAHSLPDDPEQLKQMLLELQKLIAQKDDALAKKDDALAKQSEQYQSLLERYNGEMAKKYGKSSEKCPGAGETFNEAEEILDEADNAVLAAASASTKLVLKNKAKRKPLPKDLLREEIIVDLNEDEKICDCCQGKLHKMGESRSEKLAFVPAHIKVIETVRPKYACKHCEQTGTENQVKTAPMPTSPIPKGIATASLLSQLISAKYQYGLPLYRQESMFKDYDIELSRQTMSDWMSRCSDLLMPLYIKLKEILLRQPVIHADETPLKVIRAEKATSYMWVYCCGRDAPAGEPVENIVLFDYHNSRASRCVVDYLDGFTGYLQVDGYAAYEKTEAKLAGCMAHVRRKFMDAKVVQGKKKTGKADVALNLIGKLYGIEGNIQDKPAQEKQRIRQEKSKPLIEKLYHWAIENKEKIPPSLKLGVAIGYLLNQYHKLIIYLEDGRINIDNNRAERAVKPFVIGRKNWLFSNTPRGATASAVLYSLVETAKANGLVVGEYLATCLDELAKKSDNIEHLLPWNVQQS
jgi:transposase